MPKIDVFAHVLPPQFRDDLVRLAPVALPAKSWMRHPLLADIPKRLATMPASERQIISAVNLNPDDWLAPGPDVERLVRAANAELVALTQTYPDHFPQAVAMVPMQAPESALRIIADQVAGNAAMAGIQLFTRTRGADVFDQRFWPLFAAMVKLGKPIWLHPVFDERTQDHDLTFDWEVALTKAMSGLVQAGVFTRWPDLKIIVHHAGAMVPYFAGRIRYIQGEAALAAYRHFYVDTALLGNPPALRLAASFFGLDHLLYGTDAPLGIAPNGASAVITQAIQAAFTPSEQEQIFAGNWRTLNASPSF